MWSKRVRSAVRLVPKDIGKAPLLIGPLGTNTTIIIRIAMMIILILIRMIMVLMMIIIRMIMVKTIIMKMMIIMIFMMMRIVF